MVRAAIADLDQTQDIPEVFYDKLILLYKHTNRLRRDRGLSEEHWLDASKGWRNFQACPELTDWKVHCYDLRNRIVHTAHLEVSREEADVACTAAFKAINLIFQITREEIG